MSNNRHLINVYSFPKGSYVYYWDYIGEFPSYLIFDGKTQKPANKELIYSNKIGNIYNSGYKDSFRNRDCLHSFLEFEGTLGVQGLPGFSTSIRITGTQQRLNKYSTGITTGAIIPGWGNPQSGDWQYYVVSNTTTRSEKRSYYQGRHASTIVREVVSVTLPNTRTGQVYLKYKYSVTYESWYRQKYGTNNSTSTGATYITPQYLGIMGNVALPTTADLDWIFTSLYKPSIVQHFVPDNITDDIFDNLVIPDVNNVENLKDLKQVRKSLVPIVNLLRKRSFKSLAEFYLWYKYTYKTTVMDLQSYYEFFQKWKAQSIQKSNVKRIGLRYTDKTDSVDTVTRYTVITDTYNSGVLEVLGLDINLSNTWDTLPFSFVVDWFTNIGDILARLDHSDTVSKLNVRSVITTTKRTSRLTPLTSHYCDDICTQVLYQRTISNALPVGNVSFSLKNPLSHIAEGTALIVANKT